MDLNWSTLYPRREAGANDRWERGGPPAAFCARFHSSADLKGKHKTPKRRQSAGSGVRPWFQPGSHVAAQDLGARHLT